MLILSLLPLILEFQSSAGHVASQPEATFLTFPYKMGSCRKFWPVRCEKKYCVAVSLKRMKHTVFHVFLISYWLCSRCDGEGRASFLDLDMETQVEDGRAVPLAPDHQLLTVSTEEPSLS